MTPAARSRPQPALFYCVALAALLAEIAGVLSLGGETGMRQAIGLHLCSIALVGFWTLHTRRHGDNGRIGVFVLPLTVAAGPFGVGMCLLAAITHALLAHRSESPAEWIESLFEREMDC